MYTVVVTSHMTTAEKLFHSLFSPPRPISEPKDEDHHKNSHETAISSAANLSGVKEDRCQFTFSDGRRCRNRHAQFCVHHSSRTERESRRNDFPDEGLAGPGLEALCGDLTTATNINRALSHVFLLMAQGRIPQKQAVAFGYITQLMLQTVPGIRSEYVSVHGYRAWEAKLKENLTIPSGSPSPAAKVYPQDELSPLKEVSLTPDTNEAPDPSPEGGGEEQERSRDTNEQPINGVVEQEKGVPITPFLPREKVPAPDYGDLFRRSRDMMAGKYDTTPEGRREANALALELELMNPAPAKPPRDFFGRTVALVRRLRAPPTQRNPERLQASIRLPRRQQLRPSRRSLRLHRQHLPSLPLRPPPKPSSLPPALHRCPPTPLRVKTIL